MGLISGTILVSQLGSMLLMDSGTKLCHGCPLDVFPDAVLCPLILPKITAQWHTFGPSQVCVNFENSRAVQKVTIFTVVIHHQLQEKWTQEDRVEM